MASPSSEFFVSEGCCNVVVCFLPRVSIGWVLLVLCEMIAEMEIDFCIQLDFRNLTHVAPISEARVLKLRPTDR